MLHNPSPVCIVSAASSQPASHQVQLPAPSQTPVHASFTHERANPTSTNRLAKLRYTNHSASSLVPAKRDAPSSEYLPQQGRRRTQSFSNHAPTNMSRPNLSWPQTPVERKSPRFPIKRRILFYHRGRPYYGFTNFSAHSVTYMEKEYPTSEHLFQSFKFQEHRPGLAEHIRRCCPRPRDAFSEARRFQPEVRADWVKVNIQKMDETLWYKFNQHPDLRAELLATEDAELVEDSDKDSFWGVGADRKGRNELGKALERLRERLRRELADSSCRSVCYRD